MQPQLFALNASRTLGQSVASALRVPLGEHEEREFEDGEHKARPLESVRGRDVYVLHSLYGDHNQSVNDKICRLLFFLGAIREAGAGRLTAVIPYFAYARKDRQTKPRDPVTTRYMAQILEAVGIDAIVTIDVHNVVAFQNAFRCRNHHLDTHRLFAAHIHPHVGDGPVVIASPDPGGVKRAQLFSQMYQATHGIQVGAAFMEKRRSGGVVSGTRLVGEVAGATVLIIDDLISSGGTMIRAANACMNAGAKQVFALAAHGLFVSNAGANFANAPISRIFVSDTVPPFRLEPQFLDQHIEIVGVGGLLGEAIRRLNEGGSLIDLLAGED